MTESNLLCFYCYKLCSNSCYGRSHKSLALPEKGDKPIITHWRCKDFTPNPRAIMCRLSTGAYVIGGRNEIFFFPHYHFQDLLSASQFMRVRTRGIYDILNDIKENCTEEKFIIKYLSHAQEEL